MSGHVPNGLSGFRRLPGHGGFGCVGRSRHQIVHASDLWLYWSGPLGADSFRRLIYFLRGVQIQAEDAIDRMEEIDGLFEDWRKALAGVQSGRPETVLRLFIGNPFWTAGGIAKELGVAYTTARRAIERLEAAGIVSQTGTAKRNRVYCAREMLEVLEAPHAAGRPASKSGATFGVGA